MSVSFTIAARAGEARAGLCRTPHGDFETPAFMPVGTLGAVKAVTPDDLRGIGATIVLANAYHLVLRPGVEVVRAVGGLHRFMAWDGPILSDSGGYQVFSLGPLVKVTDEEVRFRSHIDGSEHHLSPERAVEIQADLGVDISMALDHCPAGDAPDQVHRAALARTERWARRCLEARRPGQALFGIAQGGTDVALRRAQIDALAALPFDGYALGGFAVGEPRAQTHATIQAVAPSLPSDRPRYLMGMGTPEDIVAAAAAGVDMFDCVMPTRGARHGLLFTSRGKLNVGNARYAADPSPADPACRCATCAAFSLAYLRHLYKSGELLWHRLATIHNLAFYLALMRRLRSAIVEGRTLYSPWGES
ncbi:MAG: tRNA guanosine(34) transglycosylase Tgt [Myxococcota bacterium]